MNLSDKVKKINEILDSFGESAIQTYDTGSFEAIGYKPQFIIDALNEVLGVGSWRHVLHNHQLHEVKTKRGEDRTVVAVEISVQFLSQEGTFFFETGKQFGSGNVTMGNVGDGIKSAITDGIGKCLSLLSIGNRAYRGELTKPTKKMSKADASIAADLFGANTDTTKSSSKEELSSESISAFGVRAATESTTTPSPSKEDSGIMGSFSAGSSKPAASFRTKANETLKTEEEEEDSKTTISAPTARFRASGLSAAFRK